MSGRMLRAWRRMPGRGRRREKSRGPSRSRSRCRSSGWPCCSGRPEMDLEWEHHPSHFWLVLSTAAVSVALAYVTNVAAGRFRDARLVLISFAFLSAAGFLGLHALATPGVLLRTAERGLRDRHPAGSRPRRDLRGGLDELHRRSRRAHRPSRTAADPGRAARAHGRVGHPVTRPIAAARWAAAGHRGRGRPDDPGHRRGRALRLRGVADLSDVPPARRTDPAHDRRGAACCSPRP